MAACFRRNPGRRVRLGAAAAALLVAAMSVPHAADIEVPSLDGTVVMPLAADDTPTVLLFVTSDCPISNRYAPEIRRIHETFGDDVMFWLVYAGSREAPHVLREHRASFGYPFPAVLDREGALVAATGATVTPEVAVYDVAGRLVYRGRINDQYVEFGVTRAAPTRHDLRDVLTRVVAGEELALTTTEAVGCYIPGLGA